MSPLKTAVPDPLISSMLCGVPWSSFEKAIVNGLPAGPVQLDWTKAMPLASTVTSAAPPAGGPPLAGAPEPAGAPDPAGAADAGGAPEAGGAPDAPAEPVPPLAGPVAKTLDWRIAAPRVRIVSAARRRDGVPGARSVLEMAGRVRLDRAAIFLDRVGQPADERGDEGDHADRQQPSAEDEAQQQQEDAHGTEERPP